MAETPRWAHLALLLFLGSAFVTGLAVLAAAACVLARSWRWTKVALSAAAAVAGGYVLLWLGVGVASSAKTLAPGQHKYFCEADCHIAYSIEGVREAASLGSEQAPVQARGRFVIVTLRSWFDEHSVAPFRGTAPLWPGTRRAVLVDDTGRVYERSAAEAALSATQNSPMTEPLRPGQSYATLLAYDVPPAAHGLRLLITDLDPFSQVIIDDENSPFHGKIYLALH